MQLRGSPTQSSGSDAIGNPSDELGAKGRISGGREREDEMRELSGDRLVVEGGEGGEERGEEEVRVESEKGLKKNKGNLKNKDKRKGKGGSDSENCDQNHSDSGNRKGPQEKNGKKPWNKKNV